MYMLLEAGERGVLGAGERGGGGTCPSTLLLVTPMDESSVISGRVFL